MVHSGARGIAKYASGYGFAMIMSTKEHQLFYLGGLFEHDFSEACGNLMHGMRC